MKNLSEKQRVGQVRRNKVRFRKELKRKAKRKELSITMERIRISGRRLGKLQKQMFAERMRIIRENSST